MLSLYGYPFFVKLLKKSITSKMATLAILNNELNKRGVYDSFWSFILSQETGVIGTAAGVTLGITTAVLAYILVQGFIIPLLAKTTIIPLQFLNKTWATSATRFIFGTSPQKIVFEWFDVWRALLIWTCTILIIFIILEGLRKIAQNKATLKQQQQQPKTT